MKQNLSPPPREYRILVISYVTPEADKAAGDRRFIVMLQMLATRFHVDLWISNPDTSRSFDVDFQNFAAIGVNLLGYDRSVNHALSVVVARSDYDLAIFEFYGTYRAESEVFRRSQPWAKRIIDTVDVEFHREAMGAAVGVGDAEALEAKKQDELSAYRAADGLILITDFDEKILLDEGRMPATNVIIPIIFPSRERLASVRQQEVLFIGGFRHAPNEDGIKWFVGAAWPAVRAAVPQARLTIVGSHPTAAVAALESEETGIKVLGFVPDTNPYLDRAAVSIAPLRFGAGMKGKVCEAMASGLPVVTTSCGAQGLACTSGKQIHIDDSASGFADAVIALLRDPERAEQIGRAGQAFVETVCGPEQVEADLLAYATSLMPPRPHSTQPLKLRYNYVKAYIFSFLRWQKYRLSARAKGK